MTYEDLRETFKRLHAVNMQMGLNHVEANVRAMETLWAIARHMRVTDLLHNRAESDCLYIPSAVAFEEAV